MTHLHARSAFGRKTPPVARQGQSRLLIAEDQELLAQYMAIVADDLGWSVEVAGSVKAVERMIEEHRPEVLVLDLGLPDGDGVELLRYLSRRNFAGAILIVSSCDDGVLESCDRLAGHLGLRVAGRARKPMTASRFAELLNGSVPDWKH